MQTDEPPDAGKIRRATHGSPKRPLRIGELEIPCYVLEGGTRVLSGRGMQTALALGQRHGALLKGFLDKSNIKPLIPQELAMVLAKAFWLRATVSEQPLGWPMSP